MPKVQLSEEEIQKLLSLYQEGYSLKVCGEKIGYSKDIVKRVLKENNIEIRPYALHRANNGNREKVKDKTFFSKERENSNMAWLLGFLASDGTVSSKNNGIKIGLSSKDEEILYKIKDLLSLTNSNVTHYVTNKGFDVSELFWTCQQHKKDLARYGIIPRKTFNLKPPYELNEKFYIDYIRGYFDGDGSITMTDKQYLGLGFKIVSATPEILNFIGDVFQQQYDIKKPKIYSSTRQRTNPLYSLEYSTNPTIKIYQYLYHDDTIYLKRKKDRYEELIKMKQISKSL